MGNKQIKKFDRIYQEFVDSVFLYFKNRLSNRDDAKDLTQETFLKFWDYYLKDNKEVSNPRSLIFTIAHNLLVNKYERTKQSDSLDQMLDNNIEMEDVSQAEEIINLAEGEILKDKIEKLPETDREIIYLRYYENMTIGEIAEITSQKENNISVKIHRIIEKLKKDYE